MSGLENFILPFFTRDNLKIGSSSKIELYLTSQADVVAAIDIRGITKDGQFSIKHTSANDGSEVQTILPLSDFPIFVSVVDRNSALLQGSCYARLDLYINGVRITTLCSGYVEARQPLTYPIVPMHDPIPGRGQIKLIQSTDPAAGAEVNIQLPSNRLWRIIQARVQLVTDANVANRRVKFRIDYDGASTDFYVFSDQDQAASLTRNYTFISIGSVATAVSNTEIIVPLPNELWVGRSGAVLTSTFNKQAADNYGIMSLVVEEFFLNA